MVEQPKDGGSQPLPKLSELRVPPGAVIPLKEYRLADYPAGQNRNAVALVLLSRPDLDPPKGQVFVEDRQKFLELACHILDKLDPVTNEQILARIRKLVEDRGPLE